jgi:TolB protein
MTGLAASHAGATFPGHNGRIVFVSAPRLHRSPQIYSVKPDGTHKRRITDRGYNLAPSVDPSGRRVAFMDQRGGLQPDIFTIGMNGRHLRQVTNGPAAEVNPAFSGPLGKRIAYAGFRRHGRGSNIWVTLSDRSSRTQLTHSKDGVINNDPAFSPNGRKIAFDRYRRPFHSQIWVMRSDGTRIHRLTNRQPGKSNFDPCFSPSGKRIVFARTFSDTRSAIFVMRRNGSHVRRLTSGRVQDSSPAFSPNGKRIAFERSSPIREGEIMVMKASGARVHKITHSPVDDEAPSWASRR